MTVVFCSVPQIIISGNFLDSVLKKMEVICNYDKTSSAVIVTTLDAEITNANLRVVVAAGLEAAKKNQSSKLLFDVRDNRPGQSLMDGWYSMQQLSGFTGLTENFRCAVVYDPERYPETRAEFMENVVKNRPNPPFRMFTDFDEALKWLS